MLPHLRTTAVLSQTVIALLLTNAWAFAGVGREDSYSAADLVVTIDGRWAGCGYGGYYPLRIKVANRGLERDLTFRFSAQANDKIPTVRRSVRVAQNATARLTLSIPCVGLDSYGELQVYEDGRLIRELSHSVPLPDCQQSSLPRPALLVISRTNEDLDPFETAVTSTFVHAGSPGPAMGSSGYSGPIYHSVSSDDHQIVGPEMLPDSWIDYTGLDLVATSLATLEALTPEERAALLKWVHCGGTLIVYEVGAPAAQSPELSRLLQLDRHAAASAAWEPAPLNRRNKIAIIETDDYGNVISQAGTAGMGGMAPGMVPAAAAPADSQPADFVWPESVDTFARRELMLGAVYAFRENPFPGSAHDWGWFLNSVPQQQKTWPTRHGIAARWGSDEFLKFLIPSVKGVPVFAFVFLISVFTVVIGPLNYLWLWKRRRLYLLVLTIPALALATSLVLFGYSAIAHGFSTKSRTRSLTLIDQQNDTAVSLSRIALYSGLAPSDGLKFSPETAVYPIWPEETSFEAGAVDWTNQQRLPGWLRSRTRTQFLTVSHRDERGRLVVSSAGTDRLRVENGLEWRLDALVVSDDAGRLFYGADIAAGDAADLSPITDEQRREVGELLRQHPLEPPATSGGDSGIFNWTLDFRYLYSGATPVHFEASLLEQQLRRLQDIASAGNGLEPQSYVAVVGENPGLELGVETTRPQVSLHVLLGHY